MNGVVVFLKYAKSDSRRDNRKHEQEQNRQVCSPALEVAASMKTGGKMSPFCRSLNPISLHLAAAADSARGDKNIFSQIWRDSTHLEIKIHIKPLA